MALEGLKICLDNINRELDGIKKRQMAGMLAAGHVIQGRSQKRVPVEHGPLRASAYTRKETPQSVIVGYGAAYALAVHESVGEKLKGKPRPSGLGVYWGPSGGAKFLERTFREGKADIIRIVRDYSAIRK